MLVHEIKALARHLDRQRKALSEDQWPVLFEDVLRLRALEWSGVNDSCPDCRRSRKYGHQCSCPVRLVLKYLGPRAAGLDCGRRLGENGAVGTC